MVYVTPILRIAAERLRSPSHKRSDRNPELKRWCTTASQGHGMARGGLVLPEEFTAIERQRFVLKTDRLSHLPPGFSKVLKRDTIEDGSMPRMYVQWMDLPPLLKRFLRGRPDRGR